MSSNNVVRVLPILVKKPLEYPALALCEEKYFRGELGLTYSQFHGWNWANVQDQLERSDILPLRSLPMQDLAAKLEALKGWTLKGITEEAYEQNWRTYRDQETPNLET